MIICKSLEVMKSYIIILSVDCNTHLRTLIKKQKKFSMQSFSAKNKGGGGRVTKHGVFLEGGHCFWALFFRFSVNHCWNFWGGHWGRAIGCPPLKKNTMSPSGGKTHFFGQTEISGRWGDRGSQNLAGWEIFILLILPVLKGFSI